jgi:hypothetical protein
VLRTGLPEPLKLLVPGACSVVDNGTGTKFEKAGAFKMVMKI